MLKLIPLLIKFAPILWAFIKEVVLKREDKRYLIRNKFQVFVTVLIMLYTLMLYVLHEGYNAHAKESMRKSSEIQELIKVIERKTAVNKELRLNHCPTEFDTQMFQDLVDEKTIDKIEINNHIKLDQK